MVLGACQKDAKIQNKVIEEEHQVTKSTAINDIEFHYSYDGIDNVFNGQDFRNKLNWSQVDTDGVKSEIGAIKYDFSDLGKLEFDVLDENTVTLKTDLGMTTFEINEQDDSKLSFSAPVSSNRTVNFSLIDPNSSIESLFDNYVEGDIVILDDIDVPAIWPLVFAAATLIASAVDYYCDGQISSGASSCTEQGLCTIVHSCSVSCVPC